MNTKQFVIRNNITAHVERADSNPNIPDWSGANHYKVRLARYLQGGGRREMTTYFSMGSAHTREPAAADVLDCIASDAAGVDGNNFEDWCSELGYDSDSRRAERTYKACQKSLAQLQRFLGKDLAEQLMYQVERL